MIHAAAAGEIGARWKQILVNTCMMMIKCKMPGDSRTGQHFPMYMEDERICAIHREVGPQRNNSAEP